MRYNIPIIYDNIPILKKKIHVNQCYINLCKQKNLIKENIRIIKASETLFL